MTQAASQHALFDANSLLSQLRREFTPGEKLYGMFLYDVFSNMPDDLDVPEIEACQPTDKHMVDLASSLDIALGAESARELRSSLLPSTLADGRVSVRPMTFIVSEGGIVKKCEDVSVSARLKDGKYQATVKDANRYSGRPCRVLLLEQIVRENLMQVAGISGSFDEAKLATILADSSLRVNRELARFVAALPDLDGAIDAEGDCILEGSLPPEAECVPENTCVVLVIG
ncbi:MAG: hypothetical protein U1A77_16260 [Pirellulales bacterium]